MPAIAKLKIRVEALGFVEKYTATEPFPIVAVGVPKYTPGEELVAVQVQSGADVVTFAVEDAPYAETGVSTAGEKVTS
jgi:hypothetical protein